MEDQFKKAVKEAAKERSKAGKDYETRLRAYQEFIAGANFAKEYIDKQPSALVSALKEAKEVIQWMWDKMEVVDKSLQSDAFNLPANAIGEIDRVLDESTQQPPTKTYTEADLYAAWEAGNEDISFDKMCKSLAEQPPVDAEGIEAVKFANWLNKNDYAFADGLGNFYDMNNQKFTTNELYQEFKESNPQSINQTP